MYAPNIALAARPAHFQDYRARAVALARELIMIAADERYHSGWFDAGLQCCVENAGERPPGGNCRQRKHCSAATVDYSRTQPSVRFSRNAVDEAICTIDGGYLGNASKEERGE